jgi:hypothetical protein
MGMFDIEEARLTVETQALFDNSQSLYGREKIDKAVFQIISSHVSRRIIMPKTARTSSTGLNSYNTPPAEGQSGECRRHASRYPALTIDRPT